jgi:hypothetical protein
VDGERFKTQNYFPFQSAEFDNETPFKLQYIQTEVMEAENLADSESTSSDRFVDGLFREDYLESGEEKQEVLGDEVGMGIEGQLGFDAQLALFSSETHDQGFSELLADLASDAEENFVNFSANTGYGTELGEILEKTDFESKFDRFFAMQYAPMADNFENQIDRFSAHLEQHLQPDMTFEEAAAAIESFQVVEPEQFLGKIGKAFNKVKNIASSVIKKGIDVAKKVATAPLQAILSKIKPLIRPMLKSLLKKGIGMLPEKYRGLAQKALGSLGLDGEVQSEASGEELLRSEVLGTYETEAEGHDILHEGFDLELEGDSLDELYGVAETERDFDRQVFSIADAEIHGISYDGFTYESPEYEEMTNIESEIVSLDRARNEFVSGLTSDSPDIQKLTQDFVPAILPALKMGIQLVGRPKVVDFLANLVARLLQRVVEKNAATPLSKALVDAGLRIVNLEVPEPVTKEQYLASIATNIVTETVDRVSRLPVTILDGEDEVVQSFIQDAILRSTVNNVPSPLLNEVFIADRELPAELTWIPRNDGKYKVLSKKYTITLDPSMAASLRTWKRGEKLVDLLRKYQGWDGKTPVQAVVHIFEATPATRISMMAKDYLGGFSRRQTRQIIPLGRNAATLLFKEPRLATPRPSRGVMAGRRFYLVQITKEPSTTGSMPVAQSSSVSGYTAEQPNNIDLKLVSPNSLELKVYLNESTAQRIKRLGGNMVAVELYKEIESLVLPTGSNKMNALISAFNIPRAATKEIVSLLVGWIAKNLKTNLAGIVARFSEVTERPEQGVTIAINVELPSEFSTQIATLNSGTIGAFVSKFLSASPKVKVDIAPGYSS